MSHPSLAHLGSVCVLGASRGIGRACVEQLAAQGVQEIHAVARRRTELDKLRKEIAAEHPDTQVVVHAVDLMDATACGTWIHSLEDKGELPRHWVFNVGGSPSGTFTASPFESLEWRDLEAMLRFNFELPVRLTHAILPELLRPDSEGRSEGSLIYISSQAAYHARPGHAAYSAAKSGLSHFAASLFEEVRVRGIRVSVVAPGMVETPVHPDSPRFDRNRFIPVADVASSVAWILGADARTCPSEIHLRPQMDPLR